MPKRKSTRVADSDAKKQKIEEENTPKFGCQWKSVKDAALVRYTETEPGRSKIAGFDIDWTLTATASGRKFVLGSRDWKWLYDCVPDKLKALDKDGYRIVFITNQAGIEKNKTTPKEVMDRIDGMAKELNIPVLALACTGTNHYRKPATMMWEDLVKHYNHGVEVDKSKSFYVGDAAGRAKNWAPDKPKDFSCSDRMFAANVGIGFYTPEEYFLEEKPAPFKWLSVNPLDAVKKMKTTTDSASYHSKEQELVLMIGMPASGKSTFCKRYFAPHGYEIVNRDTLKTPKKCLDATKAAIASGKSVAVDNTNPAASTRAEYINLAKKKGVKCRCFYIQTPEVMAHHLNFVRMNLTDGKIRRIPDVGYNVYKKNFEEPTLDEGFTEIKKIEFVPKFDGKKHESMFKQWTT